VAADAEPTLPLAPLSPPPDLLDSPEPTPDPELGLQRASGPAIELATLLIRAAGNGMTQAHATDAPEPRQAPRLIFVA
jgi:hypothetical protein